MAYKTHVGSLQSYKKGVIELDDDLRKYAFSNVFEVAGNAQPFERVAVVQNLQYVAEVVRAEGDSPSTRTTSATYWRFCTTATRSKGADFPATSKTLEKAYFLRSSSSSITPFL